jgi:hypothetical protein
MAVPSNSLDGRSGTQRYDSRKNGLVESHEFDVVLAGRYRAVDIRSREKQDYERGTGAAL